MIVQIAAGGLNNASRFGDLALVCFRAESQSSNLEGVVIMIRVLLHTILSGE